MGVPCSVNAYSNLLLSHGFDISPLLHLQACELFESRDIEVSRPLLKCKRIVVPVTRDGREDESAVEMQG